MSLSGWCATPPGVPSHDAACRVCQMRQDDGLIGPCDCPGHDTSEAGEPCPT